jgi:MFS superfamily sulfate permease-like transporter
MADGKQGQFQELGVFGPLILMAIAAALSVAAIGLFLRRGWGRWLSVALLVVNLGPDVPGLFGGDWSILLFAVPVVALVVFLCSPPVSQVFARVPQGSRRPTEED